jgi:hypothetical protein
MVMVDPPNTIAIIISYITRTLHVIIDRIQKVWKQIKDTLYRIKTFLYSLRYVPVIGLVVSAIAILKNPLEFIMMLGVAILITIIWVIYWFTALPGVRWIPFIIWFFAVKMVPIIIYSIIMFLIIALISIVLIIIALINSATGGKLNNIVLCQNSPMSWYLTPNYHLGNKFERSLFCKSPCAGGYKPDIATGEFCERLPRGQPSYCPQAEIMRIFTRKKGFLEQHIYENFNPTKHFFFNFMTPEQKELRYKEYYLKRDKFFKSCKDTLGKYDFLSINLCANIDALSKMGLSQRELSKLKEVCQQGFCDSKNHFMFCKDFGMNKENTQNLSQLIKDIVKFIIILLIFMFLLFFTYMVIKSF